MAENYNPILLFFWLRPKHICLLHFFFILHLLGSVVCGAEQNAFHIQFLLRLAIWNQIHTPTPW